MDAPAEAANEEVVVMKSAQVGWTEILGNIVGYFIDQDAAPQMVLQPTLDMAEAWSKDRLAPMVRDTPRLTAKVSDVKGRASGNTVLHKSYPGGQLTIAGANSAASLASRPIRVVLADEVDRYPPSAGTEGDPLALAYKRTNNFWNRRKLAGSTPTLAGVSRIEAKFLESDQRRFFVPCPHCGERQVLRWERVHWEKAKDGSHRPETTAYACEACGALWDDAERWAACSRGEWRATAPFKGIAGFHVWEAYSPWVKLAATVRAFLEAKKSPETLKVWTNTALGETWQERGEAPDWERLYERRRQELKLGEVPDGAAVLTCGADVQRNRIEADVWGWGAGMTSWLIDHRVFHGDPAGEAVWRELDAFLAEEWEAPDGRRMRVARTAIDTGDGYSTTSVYAWARRHPREVMAIKGVGRFDTAQPVSGPTWVDATIGGRKLRRGCQLWTVAVSVFKSETYAWLRLPPAVDGGEAPPGTINLPQGVDAEWIQQLVAEQLVKTRTRAGTTRLEWQKTRERNEAIDMRVYARAASYALGLDRWPAAKWAKVLGIAPTPVRAEDHRDPPARGQDAEAPPETKSDLGPTRPSMPKAESFSRDQRRSRPNPFRPNR